MKEYRHLIEHTIGEAQHFGESVEPRMQNGEKSQQQKQRSRQHTTKYGEDQRLGTQRLPSNLPEHRNDKSHQDEVEVEHDTWYLDEIPKHPLPTDRLSSISQKMIKKMTNTIQVTN